MRTASRPRLHVCERGDGEPLLAVTGWTISSAVFDPIADRYAEELRCVAYDHRGSGRSAPWVGPVSMAMLAADAARVLDDRGIEAAHVAGVSMGGLVALELALRMPHRVRSLVLVGATAGLPVGTSWELRDALGAAAGFAGDSLRAGRVDPTSLLFSARFRAERPDEVRRLVRPFTQFRPPPWTTASQTIAATWFDRHGALGRVRAPTLVVHGGRDAMVPVSSAHVLADGIPGAELHLAPESGHAVPFEEPEATAERICAFVQEHADDPLPPAPDALGRAAERAGRAVALPAGLLRAQAHVARRLVGGG